VKPGVRRKRKQGAPAGAQEFQDDLPPLPDGSIIKFHQTLLQHREVFIFEGLGSMPFFLVEHVVTDFF